MSFLVSFFAGVALCAAGCTRGPGLDERGFEKKSGLQFLQLPAGSFHFGCEPQDRGCYDVEKPGHTVSVRALAMGKTEVTVEAYQRCVEAGVCRPPRSWREFPSERNGPGCNYGKRPRHPVNCISWDRAAAFCGWIGGRLPTAEEWEYAAKGGAARVYPWGDEPPTEARCRFGWGVTDEVGAHPAGASAWGLLDMAGNVWEWTSSEWKGDKEARGGSIGNLPRLLRASARDRHEPIVWSPSGGFRCVLEGDFPSPGKAR